VDACLHERFGVPPAPYSDLSWYEGHYGTHPDGAPIRGIYLGGSRIGLLDGPRASVFIVSHEVIHARTGWPDTHPAFGPDDGYELGDPESTCELNWETP
jgi:hypothetical protein